MDELPYKVIISNGNDELLARAARFELAQAAYLRAVSILPKKLIELRHGARIIQRSDRTRNP